MSEKRPALVLQVSAIETIGLSDGKEAFVRLVPEENSDGACLRIGYLYPPRVPWQTPSEFSMARASGFSRREIESLRDDCQKFLGGYSYAELQRENCNLANRVTELQHRLEEAESEQLFAEETRDAQQSREAETVAAEERP